MSAATTEKNSCSNIPFFGLGAQSDCFLYDDRNVQCGVTAEDFLLNEQRLAGLRLAHARMFVDVRWFDPHLAGKMTKWDGDEFRHFLRHLRSHKENGTRCNLVLFKPMHPSAEETPLLVRAMADCLRYLVHEEGMTNVAWLTLWNEPDPIFPYESPLGRRIWGDDIFKQRPGFSVYVEAVRLAYELLHRYDLDRTVNLIVPDTVWGGLIRRQQMGLALEAFHDLDVVYAYHNYNPEDQAFYEGNDDFAYEGVGQEAAAFRSLLGPDRPLLITEFNSSTGHGFNSHCLGFGPGGREWTGSKESTVDAVAKVIIGVTHGIDGFSYWCAHDVIYEAHCQPMATGLWRYKTADWAPRPIYHYYSLLADVLRPGAAIHRISGLLPEGVHGMASSSQQDLALVFLNAGDQKVDVDVQLPEFVGQAIKIRQVNCEKIPPVADRACFETGTCLVDRQGIAKFHLEPAELIVCETASGDEGTKR